MTERPQQLDRLDIMLAGVDIAHTVIFDMHRELLGSESAQTESASLLAESAALTTVRAPQLTESLRGLAGRWDEQTLLDPEAADRTAEQIAAEFATVEPALRSLVARQTQIAARLRLLLGD
jgi:hypothetical protein